MPLYSERGETVISALPTFVGFTIGNAIAALAFTITIQQFLKPIHRFRLYAWGVSIQWLFIAVFAGSALVFVGNILRYFAKDITFSFWLVPISEVSGGVLFFIAYLATAFISLAPIKVQQRNAPRVARAAILAISTAKDEDYTSLFNDIAQNIVPLARLAAFIENYRDAGFGYSEPTAFYDFIHREKLVQSTYARTLIRFLSDPHFCAVIVQRDPLACIQMLRKLAAAQIQSDAVADLVQEIARQAVISDESMLAREVGYKGFSELGLFLNAMFGNRFIINNYRPFSSLTFFGDTPVTAGLSERLSAAIELSWERAVEAWSPQAFFPIKSCLESAFFNVRYADSRKQPHEQENISLFRSVIKILQITEKHIETQSKHKLLLYRSAKDKKHPSNLPALTAEIVVGALNSIANDFAGFEDRRWSEALDIFRALFPFSEQQEKGLSPTQQHAAVMIKEKLEHNMRGFYPALTRVLLAVVGPYGSKKSDSGTAFSILQDIAYEQWSKLPQLYESHPEKISHYLPPNLEYDYQNNMLIHTYRGGDQAITKLSDLDIPEIDLFDLGLYGRLSPDQ